MEVDLTFNGSPFGKVKLPGTKTSIWGAPVKIIDQRLHITDMTVFKAYVRSTIVDDDTSFRLDNGVCTIKSLGLTANCTYGAEVASKAMMGPRMTLAKLDRSEDDISVTLTVQNPSPLEIDYPVSFFELRNTNNETMAELKGGLKIVRGSFDLMLQGKVKAGVVLVGGKVRLVGVGVEGASWCNETVQYIDTVMDVSPNLAKVLQV